METQRWETIERIFHSARDQAPEDRSRFLDSACGDDLEVRRIVEALLQQDHPSLNSAPTPSAELFTITLLPGAKLGPYEIVEVAGIGGMGQVYRARDSRLKRDVAIKMLPPDLASDSKRLAQIDREATLLASLNHPNIAAIYDVIEGDDAPYLVLEFVEGVTLDERLRKGLLPTAEVLHIALQIAGALEASHEKGIVHRDLKPANIKITPGGQVKVLDFGIAEALTIEASRTPVEAPPVVPTEMETRVSSLRGTPAYMSPEQLMGGPVDPRTDIWAFGCVLYEVLTGRRPFYGDTALETADAVLNVEPRWSSIKSVKSDELQRLIRQCLKKEASQRTQSAKALRLELQKIAEQERSRTPWKRLLAAGLLLALIAAAGFVLLKPAAVTAPRAGQTQQLTFAPEVELDPALSPDGRTLAYASRSPDRIDIYVLPLSGGEPINLTKDEPGPFHRWPRWSPDGKMIAFVSAEPGLAGIVQFTNNFRLQVLPYPGGRARQVATSAMLGHSWSPDGKKLVYMRDREVWISSLGVGSDVKIAEGLESHSPSWSPDGRWITFVSGNSEFTFSTLAIGNQAPSSIMLVQANGGPARRLTDQINSSLHPIWISDSRSILFISNRDRGGSWEVFQLAISGAGEAVGAPVRITSGLNPFSIDLSADGRKLIYSTLRRAANLWSLPVPESPPVSASAAKPVTTGAQSIEGVSVSRDGEWIAFDSNRGGNQDIYRMRINGGTLEQLTDDPSDDFLPSWSPDGKSIAFYSFRNGNRDIYVMSADGAGEEQVTNDPAQERYPIWSPDGQNLVFVSDKTGTNQLYILSKSEGGWGGLRQLTNDRAFWPDWSPDGRYIAYEAFLRPPDGGIAIVPAEGGAPRLFIPASPSRIANYPRWSRDGRTIYFKGVDAQSRSSLWAAPLNGDSPRLLVTFDDPLKPFLRVEFAVSEKEFFFTLTETASDIWLLNLEN